MHWKGILLIMTGISLISLSPLKPVEDREDILWYDRPAETWEEALPLGNGRIGVMVFGSTSGEHLQLNDDSLWPADLGWSQPEGNVEDLRKIRELLFQGRNVEADRLFVEKFSNKSIVRSHQTLGDLYIDFNHTDIANYRRELNISSASAVVSYDTRNGTITEKILVSHPDNAIIMEITSVGKKGISGRVRLSRPEDDGHPTAVISTTDEGILIMEGEVTQRTAQFRSQPAPILEGVKFETCLRIKNEGGKIKRGADFLELKKVRKATFYIVSNSSYYADDFKQQNRKDLSAIYEMDFQSLQRRHTRDYKELYDRVKIQLTRDILENISTEERINRIRHAGQDLGLEALLFQYGRYLLISSSREGTNPANLQGLWNPHITAPWNADYHLNINLQMNYWLANVTNLSELNNPLFDYVDRLVEHGKNTATVNFGCRGSFMPHASDLWAPTWLRAATAYWGCSMGAGGWMMQHYWEHFAFTRDKTFLKERVMPALLEVAQFYSDWIIRDPRDGTLISAPSTSPENQYINASGDTVATCLGSAMDQQVIAEVFDHYIQACEILKLENELLNKIRKQREQLRPGFVLGNDGRILEWDREYKELEPGHRHMSHIYGFHPGTSITKEKTPDMFEAVRRTLDFRLANGGAGTGWSRAWLINCSARLLDGDMAHDHIQFLFKKSILPNLFDSHPPFQIDGNFGYTAGVAEMLIQSHEDDLIRILPALPEAWENGFVQGLKTRGGLVVDIYWKDNQLEKAVIKPEHSGGFRLAYRDKTEKIFLMKGRDYVFKP